MQLRPERKSHAASTIVLLILLLNAQSLLSQFSTYSPYSRFGLGDLSKQGVGQNLAMGGAGVALHPRNRINFLNPASFSSLDSTSVYFDFGLNSFHNQYRTEQITNSWWNVNLHHVAFASSMGKYLGLSAGIIPYSSIGYNIKQEYNDYTSGEAMDIHFKGDGGIMDFYVGASVKLFDRIAVGGTMNYLMGRLSRKRLVEFPSNSSYSIISSTENFDLRKPMFTLGLQYKEVFKDKFFFTLGGVYDFPTTMDAEVKYNIINDFYPTLDTISLGSSELINPHYPLERDTTLDHFTIPQRIGIGLALGIPDKLIVTGEYHLRDWTGVMQGFNYSTTRSTSFRGGIEYIPDVQALRGYYHLMSYRIGGYYTNYYLMVNGYQLKDYGITFGVGLPVRTMRSSLNVAFTLGTRGTTEYNLVKENYGIITFNVTLHDLWFRKRRFE